MGWLCRRCNSENEFGGDVCRACGAQPSAAYLLLEKGRAGRERRAFASKAAALSKPIRPSVFERADMKRFIGRVNMAAASLLIVLLLAPVIADGAAEEFAASRLNSEYIDARLAQIQERVSGRLSPEAAMQTLAARAEELMNRGGTNAAVLGDKRSVLAERTGAALDRIRETAEMRGNSGSFGRLGEAVSRNLQAADMKAAEIEWRAAWFEPASWLQTAVEMLFEQTDVFRQGS